jgi:hypothetical protein
MDELALQKRIVKEVTRVKGWARKIGNPQQAGTPDLFIKMYTLPAVMIECKKDKLKLTPIQRETIRRLLQAEMPTAWLVYEREGNYHHLFVGSDPDAVEAVAPKNCSMITYGGKTWDIGEIVKAVVYWSQREMDKFG